MTRPEDIIQVRAEGLYCVPGDFYVDPVRAVPRAVVTHGHSDHARPGHGAVLATPETVAIMQARLGADACATCQPLAYHQTMNVGEARVRLVPAGHILGSAQAVIEANGLRVVVSGDYKRCPDPTCPPFEPVPCDVFITEATFALPVFRNPPFTEELGKLLASRALYPDRTHLIGAYSLGKAQRLIKGLRELGFEDAIYIHGAMERLCALYEEKGIALGPLRLAVEAPKEDLSGAIVIAPPAALEDRWTRRMSEPVLSFASGWMRVRARARQRNLELPLIISDHADWDELTQTIREIAPGEVWITHGSEEALQRWCELQGTPARPLSIVGYDEEEGEEGSA